MSTLNQGLGVKAGGSSSGGGGTDTNLGNTDLTSDATRTFDLNGNDLTIDNGTTDIVKFDASSNNLQIGNASKYSMPTARGSSGDILRQTSSGGTISFQALSSTMTYNAQSPAGIGFVKDTIRAGFQYGFSNAGTNSGKLVPIQTDAASGTINHDIVFGLQNSFRQLSSTNYSGVASVGRIVGKITSSIANTYTIKVLAVNMGDGRVLSVLPWTATGIGDITFGKDAGTSKCFDFAISDEVPEIECLAYFMVIVPDTDAEAGEVGCTLNYVLPNNITNTYS